jgi:predicted membrane channel-forming protein YqfA (hemolysin III family)
MPFFRLLIALTLIGILASVGAYFFTKNPRYLQWAQQIFKLLVLLGLAFFAILILERVV